MLKRQRITKKILAIALHRICKIEIKENGNDLDDAKICEECLHIEIQIYDLNSRMIYRGTQKPTKVYILVNDKHYDVISNLTGFTCANASQNKSRVEKYKACGNKTKCNGKSRVENVSNIFMVRIV